jgi:hypothetical protein
MKYKVMTLSSSFQRSDGRVGSYIITDQPIDFRGEDIWPFAVEFKVSMRYDDATQLRRAYEYCDYLNKGIVIQPPIGA